MCIRITERYAVCRCIYYIHGVDQCQATGQVGHEIQERTVLVGYSCEAHSSTETYQTTDADTTNTTASVQQMEAATIARVQEARAEAQEANSRADAGEAQRARAMAIPNASARAARARDGYDSSPSPP